MKLTDYLKSEAKTGIWLASKIGCDPAYLSQMIVGRRPFASKYCTAIEKVTKKAVTRAELRPDDYWLIWPDLKAPKKTTTAEVA